MSQSVPIVTTASICTARLWRWADIDTILLDMDGTLLDLRFDNYFWSELIPERYAQACSMPLVEARAVLVPKFAARQGTLDWYCTDYWTRELGLNIVDLKHQAREQVRFLEGAERFLQTTQSWGKRLILVTNAHRDSLRIKVGHTQLGRYFEQVASSHDFGMPKEQLQFWDALLAHLSFDPWRTLFVDDSLAVLRAAQSHGIRHLMTIAQPDSTLPPRLIHEFPSVRRIADLLDCE